MGRVDEVPERGRMDPLSNARKIRRGLVKDLAITRVVARGAAQFAQEHETTKARIESLALESGHLRLREREENQEGDHGFGMKPIEVSIHEPQLQPPPASGDRSIPPAGMVLSQQPGLSRFHWLEDPLV